MIASTRRQCWGYRDQGISATVEHAIPTGKNAMSTAKVPLSIIKAPSFIRPTGNPETVGGDTFGPIVQPGSTIIGVNETSTTSTMTVACFKYLSAQSVSLVGQAQGFGIGCSDQEHMVSFGRNPDHSSCANGELSHRSECKSGAGGRATREATTANPDTYCDPPCLQNPQDWWPDLLMPWKLPSSHRPSQDVILANGISKRPNLRELLVRV